MPPPVLVLNDDVLRQIADYLLGKDALSFSLTSKLVYDLVIHRVSALIECEDRDKLWTMHRTLFYNNPERAKHIHTLIVRGSVFLREELYGSDDEQCDEREVLPSPVAPLIVDLLRIAPNIRCLTIESFDTLRASDPGVVAAMAALRRLSRIELFDVQGSYRGDFLDEEEFEDIEPGLRFLTFASSGWHLVVLSLNCYYHYGENHLNPHLLNTIAAFPRLVTLRLIKFLLTRRSFKLLGLDDKMATIPSFPSIRKLVLNDTTPYCFVLVRLCPNLSLVSITTNHDNQWTTLEWQEAPDATDDHHVLMTLGPCWNSLHSLILSSKACMYSAETFLGPTFHLRIGCQVSSDSQWQVQDLLDKDLLLDTLKQVSPVHAQLWVEVGEPTHMWEHLGEVAPCLRFLELKITLNIFDTLVHAREQNEDGWNWLDEILSALCTVRLVSLCLHFMKIPRYINFGDNEHYHPISLEDIEKVCNAGAETRKRLPLQCADVIPTLRYVAVADEEPSWDIEDEDDDEDEEDYYNEDKDKDNDNDNDNDNDDDNNEDEYDEDNDEENDNDNNNESDLADGTPHTAGLAGKVPTSVIIYGGEADEYEFQDEWYTEKIKTLQWWRVKRSFERGQKKKELHPLTPGKGKEVQAFLEKADLESIERIDEFLL